MLSVVIRSRVSMSLSKIRHCIRRELGSSRECEMGKKFPTSSTVLSESDASHPSGAPIRFFDCLKMIRILQVSLLALAASLSIATAGNVPARSTGVPEWVELKSDLPYAGTQNPRQALDLYLPRNRTSAGPLPVVVYIHGGGWNAGSRKTAGTALAFAATGNYAGISVGYRLTSEAKWPAQIHDCKAAIRWIRAHGREHNLDPDRIGVSGTSAGGHLVSMLGLTAGVKELDGNLGKFRGLTSAVTCVVDFCGPTDLTSPLMQGKDSLKDDPAVAGLFSGGLKENIAVAKAASPLQYVHSPCPPFLIAHGTRDLRVNFSHSARLHDALMQAGASSILIPLTDAGHSFANPELDERLRDFFAMHLRGVKKAISSEPIPPVDIERRK